MFFVHQFCTSHYSLSVCDTIIIVPKMRRQPQRLLKLVQLLHATRNNAITERIRLVEIFVDWHLSTPQKAFLVDREESREIIYGRRKTGSCWSWRRRAVGLSGSRRVSARSYIPSFSPTDKDVCGRGRRRWG